MTSTKLPFDAEKMLAMSIGEQPVCASCGCRIAASDNGLCRPCATPDRTLTPAAAPLTPEQVIANLREMADILTIQFEPGDSDGAWCLAVIRDIIARGIAPAKPL